MSDRCIEDFLKKANDFCDAHASGAISSELRLVEMRTAFSKENVLKENKRLTKEDIEKEKIKDYKKKAKERYHKFKIKGGIKQKEEDIDDLKRNNMFLKATINNLYAHNKELLNLLIEEKEKNLQLIKEFDEYRERFKAYRRKHK